MKRALTCISLALVCGASQAAIVNTTNITEVATFQTGLTVEDFESISGLTPHTLSSYPFDQAVGSSAFLFDQISGVQFSVGGQVGVNRPALFELTGSIAGDAQSGSTVLGPVGFAGETLFGGVSGFIEIFFPAKVASVGFWLNPSLANVTVIVANTNFAFSGLEEITLESGTGTAGNFVSIQRATADIGGVKILSVGTDNFTIDDFSFGGSRETSVPEPAAWALLPIGLAALGFRRRGRRS